MPKSELLKQLKETENEHKINEKNRIKFVEKCGSKFMNRVKISDPFRKNCPPEKECLPCRGNPKYSNWFCPVKTEPYMPKTRGQKRKKQYMFKTVQTRTERYEISPLPYLTKLLNQS